MRMSEFRMPVSLCAHRPHVTIGNEDNRKNRFLSKMNQMVSHKLWHINYDARRSGWKTSKRRHFRQIASDRKVTLLIELANLWVNSFERKRFASTSRVWFRLFCASNADTVGHHRRMGAEAVIAGSAVEFRSQIRLVPAISSFDLLSESLRLSCVRLARTPRML